MKKKIVTIVSILFFACGSFGSCGSDDDEKAPPVEKPDEKPDENPDENPDEKPGENPDEKPVTALYPVAESGWVIYDGGVYRYGPSIIIQDDGTIDAWFAAPGGTHGEYIMMCDPSLTFAAVSLGATNTAAQQFTMNEPFYSVEVRCPNWSGSPASLTLSVYQWDQDYKTTVQAAPLRTKRYANYADNAWLSLINSEDDNRRDVYFPPGDYLWVLDNGATTQSGVWKSASQSSEIEAVSYYNGSKTTGQFQARLTQEYTGGIVYWDQASYKQSTDGGKTWSEEVMALKPTEGSRDELSICDPGVAKWGDYYYIGYTSTENDGGIDNHVYVCRGKSQTGPWEKWDGTGWGGHPEPIIPYTGDPEKWGAGEPSIVVHNDTIFFYYTWDDANPTTRLATAPVDEPNWPAHLTHHGTVINKSSMTAADHCDVKYCPNQQKFFAVHTASRITPNSYIMLWESPDGIRFTQVGRMEGVFQPYLHNCGLSGDERGYIDIDKPQYISYAYGPDWGNWKTRWSPLTFK